MIRARLTTRFSPSQPAFPSVVQLRGPGTFCSGLPILKTAVSRARFVPVSLEIETSVGDTLMMSCVGGGPPARPGPAARAVGSILEESIAQEPARLEFP